MSKRQVFYSFHYKLDVWRFHQVRNMGKFEGNEPLSPNKWEEIKKNGDQAIQEWIDDNLKYRSCTIVLIGEKTAGRKWIEYEIKKSFKDKKGIVGIYIHNLFGGDAKKSNKGKNPFEGLNVDGRNLVSIIKCYDPLFTLSTDVYGHIKKHIKEWVEEAIRIRNTLS